MGYLPRVILPSQVQVGDTISVELPAKRGITTTVRGKVHRRVDSGSIRNLITSDNAVILSWNAKENRAVTVILLRRGESKQEPLFVIE